MKSFRMELWFETSRRREFINITPQIDQCLSESSIKEGLILVNAMHITASVFINDDESGLHNDFERWLEKLAPEKPYNQYQHNSFEDNAEEAVDLYKSNNNIIQENNFIKNNKITAFVEKSYDNKWIGNFWDRQRFLPKIILGSFTVNIDWNPSKEPIII